MTRIIALLISLALFGGACSSDSDDQAVATDEQTASTEATTETTDVPTTADEAQEDTVQSEADSDASAVEETDAVEEPSGALSTFLIEVWADNWMAVYVDGVLIGEDSVPITTERSVNAETFTFEATYPFTVAIEAKDFKETDSGIEYIGAQNQQMGDGGIIAQVTDAGSGDVVAVSSSDWATLVVHRAPLNTECESDPDPDATCEFEITETPADWAASGYDSSAWAAATEWSAGDVGPKDGYDEISWDGAAQPIWGTDLEVDNTILFRTTVTS